MVKANEMKQMDEVIIGGVPIDNLSLNECVEKILNFVKQYQYTGKNHYVATVNVDFLVNALEWKFNNKARHPELLEILRKADIATADGMPIVWLSKILQTPIKTRVAGSDLLPHIAEQAAQKNISIFLLGGQGDSAEKTAALLKNRHPKLTIAGTYSPRVYTEGEPMLSSEQEDKHIINKINESNADIVFIGFGNPKQELWFNRNRKHLKVAVGIGVGGSFDFITGQVKRAPLWMQNTGLEWLYRISQDPGRLWKRYAAGFFKLGFIAMPILAAHTINAIRLKNADKSDEIEPHNDIDNDQLLIKLPKRVDAESLSQYQEQWMQSSLLFKNIRFDFSQVEFIDSTALGKLIRLYTVFRNNHIRLLTTGLDNQQLIAFLKMTKVYDFFASTFSIDHENAEYNAVSPYVSNNTKSQIINKIIKSRKNMYSISTIDDENLLLKVKGRLDAAEIEELNLDNILHEIGENNCFVDLSELTFLDSTGLRFFFKLEKHLKTINKPMVMIQIPEIIHQLLKINQLQDYFKIANTYEDGKTLLQVK
jgi:N-acetylglucosaminyldiphosphoundecaprenol N-acetyl-beta-D-mannosaminyltransferase